MLDSHFNSYPNAAGNSFTLTTRLGQMISEIEKLYEPRDRSYTILGVEFAPGATSPHIWYPGGCGHIAIRLAGNAIDNDLIACYQLAHEAVHLLSPTGRAQAPTIEEGLATMYSENYVARLPTSARNYTNDARYADAADKVRQLLKIDVEAIRKLRKVQPSFASMTADTFTLAGLSPPAALIADLLRPF